MDRRILIAAVAALAVAACGSTTASTKPAATADPGATRSPDGLAPTSAGSAASPSPSVVPAYPSIEIPLSGSFVFMRYDDESRPHVWVACTDLTGARQLPTPSGLDAGWAVWSPDGKRLAFNAGHDDPDVHDALEPWDIYTMDRDGGDIRKLTNATALNGDPGYSPDGTLIAYDSTEAGKEGIWVMDAEDGAHKRLVTPMPAGLIQDYSPRFSPDGTRLVFARDVDSENEAALWTVNLDGTDLRRITPPGIYPEKSEWSPDGSRIAFDARKPGQTMTTIWLVGADGQGLTSLNTAPGDGTDDGYSKPTWSDDGSLIYLVHGIHPGPSRLGISVMRPDGTGLRYVDDGTGYEHLPDWTATPC